MRQYNASEIARILDARPAGPNGWMARCPAHDDRKPSLSIKDAGNGRTLIHCHAGCAPKQILKAMGLEMADLFPEKGKATIAARYVYLDDQNQKVLRVTRLEPKGFYQEGYRNGAWDRAAPKGKLLYRLPEIMKNLQKPVYVVEGERDADRLAGAEFVGNDQSRRSREMAQGVFEDPQRTIGSDHSGRRQSGPKTRRAGCGIPLGARMQGPSG